MEADKPSRTARMTAAHRAHESKKPAAERVCYDSYAHLFLGNHNNPIGDFLLPTGTAFWLWEMLMPGWNAYFVARTRFIDDSLEKGLNDGIEQLVILGAGYDSRALRFQQRPVKVFEVDHPATQRAKKSKLMEALGTLPAHLRLVPVDFTKDSLPERLTESGFEPDRRTMFIWEGVSMYLPPASVDETLTFVRRSSGTGSSIIFDYTHPDVVAGICRRREALMWQRSVKRMGEALLFGIEEGAIAEFLKPRGFSIVTNADHEVLKRRYFAGTNERRAITPIIEIVHASVDTDAKHAS